MTNSTSSRFINVAPDSARSKLASDLVICGGLGFVSGVRAVELGNDRAPLPEMVEAQTTKIFANLDAILAAGGLKQRNLVSVHIRMIDFDRLFERMNLAYSRCIGAESLPARSCSGVTQLTRGALVEMDFIVRIEP